jgi:hypothetical protein
MSSPRLPQPADGLAALAAAAAQVAEDSLFAYAEACPAAKAAALVQARPAAEPWLVAAVPFTGPFEGSVRLSLPRSLATHLAAAFCGLRPESLDDAQIADFAGELVNMICGLWLTQTHRTERFALASPQVAGTAAGDVAPVGEDWSAGDTIGMLLKDTPLLLTVVGRH